MKDILHETLESCNMVSQQYSQSCFRLYRKFFEIFKVGAALHAVFEMKKNIYSFVHQSLAIFLIVVF